MGYIQASERCTRIIWLITAIVDLFDFLEIKDQNRYLFTQNLFKAKSYICDKLVDFHL